MNSDESSPEGDTPTEEGPTDEAPEPLESLADTDADVKEFFGSAGVEGEERIDLSEKRPPPRD